MPSNNSTSADKPFDSSSKANIILRSSNGVDFFVIKGLLQLVSPVFDRMISKPLNEREADDSNDSNDSNDEKNELSTTPRENSAPRPRPHRSVFNMVFKGRKAKNNDNAKNELPIIPLNEDSATLYNLLLLIYPCSKEPPCTVEVYLKVGNAARKYGMDEVWEKLRKAARRASEDALAQEPFRAFAIASYFGLADVMKEAALDTLKIPLHDLGECEELRLLTISEYHDLLQWRFACRDAVKHLLLKLESQVNSPVLVRLLRERLETTDCPWIAPDIEVMSEILAEYARTSPLPFPEVVKSRRLADGEINKVFPMLRLKVKEIYPRSSAVIKETIKTIVFQKHPSNPNPYNISKSFGGKLKGCYLRLFLLLSNMRTFSRMLGAIGCYRLYLFKSSELLSAGGLKDV